MDTMLRNIEMVENKFADIMKNLKGLNAPLKEYVCDESGKLSDAKIESFSEKIISKMYQTDYMYEYIGISNSYARCLKDFIYLALRSYGGYGETVITFADLLAKLKSVKGGSFNEYKNLAEYEKVEYIQEKNERILDEDPYSEELLKGSNPTGFFVDLNRSYSYLTGDTYVSQHFNEIEKKVLDREKYEEDVKAFENANREKLIAEEPSIEELDEKYKGEGIGPVWGDDEYIPSPAEYYYYKEFGYGDTSEYQNDPDYPDYDLDEEINDQDSDIISKPFYFPRSTQETPAESNDQDEEEKIIVYNDTIRRANEEEKVNRWKSGLEDPDKYIEIYKEFRELAFTVPLRAIAVENTFIYMLNQDGKNKLNSSVDFLEFFMALDDAYMVAKKIIN